MEINDSPVLIRLFVTLRSNPSSIKAAIVAKNQHQSENRAARSPTRFPSKPILEMLKIVTILYDNITHLEKAWISSESPFTNSNSLGGGA